MSARSVAHWRAHYVSRGHPFPLDGPTLPPGWTWVCAIPGELPHRAEHDYARLSVILGRKHRYPNERTWRVEIKGKTLRAGGTGPSTSWSVREFADPAEAAIEAVAAFTGAKLRLAVSPRSSLLTTRTIRI